MGSDIEGKTAHIISMDVVKGPVVAGWVGA